MYKPRRLSYAQVKYRSLQWHVNKSTETALEEVRTSENLQFTRDGFTALFSLSPLTENTLNPLVRYSENATVQAGEKERQSCSHLHVAECRD